LPLEVTAAAALEAGSNSSCVITLTFSDIPESPFTRARPPPFAVANRTS
jgi:hypothetical protein